MMWHVVFAEPGGLPQSRAARSRDSAIHAACELLHRAYEVRRVIEPNGSFIERAELDEHYDNGHFPGLRISKTATSVGLHAALEAGGPGIKPGAYPEKMQ